MANGEPTPNADEVAVLLNSEEVKAKLDQLGDEVKGLLSDVIASLELFLKKLG